MDAALIILLFLVLMLIGIPVGTALGVAGAATLIFFDLGFEMIGVNFIAGAASFPLLAIPFFVLAGVILQRAGLAAIMARFFELLVGGRTGGLAMVAILTCMFWGALSGSGPATTAAVGLIMIAPMIRQGYDRHFAAATVANASDLSIVIPPSIAFIIYGSITSVPVGALFLAGIIPGLLTGLALLVTAGLISRRCHYRGQPFTRQKGELWHTFRRSFWALMTPVIILGGIYAGMFTPTEAAVVAVFYSLFVAGVIYRTLSFRDLIDIFVEAAVTTSVIMFIVVFAGIFSWAASTTGLIDSMARWIVHYAPNAVVMILLINFLLLFLGMFIDAISISYLVMPILIPVLQHFNVDPVWYGVIFISALAIGQATPPVGVNLFTAANLIDSDVDRVARASIPFVLAAVGVLVLISVVPILSLWLPRMAKAYSYP
jgi:C4-dicarboxylate transporter DctM subunit